MDGPHVKSHNPPEEIHIPWWYDIIVFGFQAACLLLVPLARLLLALKAKPSRRETQDAAADTTLEARP